MVPKVPALWFASGSQTRFGAIVDEHGPVVRSAAILSNFAESADVLPETKFCGRARCCR
jgi:hypothetical protein